MSLETTSTVQAALVAAQVIRDQVIEAAKPRMFILGLMCHDSMDGEGSNTVRYARNLDLGAASGGTEGVDLTPQFTHGMDTSVELSPTEAVADMSLITEDTVLRRLGGSAFRSVRDVFVSGNQGAISRLLAKDVQRQTTRGLQKMEIDALTTMLTAPSVSAGTTNTALSMLTIISAIRKMKINQPLRPPSEWAFLLPSAGVEDLQLEAIATGGGYQGTLFGGGQARFGIANAPTDDWAGSGLLGDVLGLDVYEYDDELKVTANAGVDVTGLLFCKGDPRRTPNDYAGRPPSFVYVERSPLDFVFQHDGSLRSVELIDNARYIFGELADNNHVSLLIKND
jgi:hypothetical protein